MRPLLTRTLAAAAVGALVGSIAIVLAYSRNAKFALEMDRELPRLAAGFYEVEQIGEESYAWSSRRVVFSLRGLNRRSAWTCSVRFRGGRPPRVPQPVVDVAIDGATVAKLEATNQYQDVEVQAPARPSTSGLVLTLTAEPTFVPSASDPRELGVQVDRLACQPAGALPMPPWRLLAAGAASAALLGGGFAVIGISFPAAAAGASAVAILQAMPLTSGTAPYSPYVRVVPWLAFWIALVGAIAAGAAARFRRAVLEPSARFALAFSAGALLLELLVLLHPDKPIIDAMFHAHRLEWVLGGRYYFTQPMPDGVQFPYAIGLYVVAAMFSGLTSDYMALLKIVVSASRALAGLALYPMVARAWRDTRTAAAAVVLFHLVPLPFVIMSNANFTYAFGQSMAVLTLAAVATWTHGVPNVWRRAALFAIASLAFLSHVGMFPLLLAMLLATALLYRLAGSRLLKPQAGAIALTTLLAVAFSVVVYYGHFPESYRTLDRVRGRPAPASQSAETPPRADSRPAMPVRVRLVRAANLTVRSFGWPLVILAGLGTRYLYRSGWRDSVGLLIAATALVFAGFVGFSATIPVEPRFQRYTEEFIGRVNYAAVPALVVLAACGASWGWRRGLAGRAVTAAVVAWSGWMAVRDWLRPVV